MKNLKARDYFLVIFQLFIFALFVPNIHLVQMKIPEWLKIPALIITVLGALIIVLAILQLNRNLSPFPTPKLDSQLVKNGLYKFIRHPIYTGILLSFLGYAVYSESLYRILITLALFILFQIKSRYEENLLIRRYKDYRTYKKKTGRFFPALFVKNKI